jgi:hypothetical protein
MITDHTIAIWRMAAKDDNWHRIFVASDIREMVGEIERLRRDCAELYQVIGSMAEHCPESDNQSIIKALDNAYAASIGEPRVHDDLLPFVLPNAPIEQSEEEEPSGFHDLRGPFKDGR